MTDALDSRTPGRLAAGSALARADLRRRLERLPLAPDALARVARAVEAEVEAALAARDREGFTTAEIEAAGGSAELIAALERRRADRERAEAIRKAGLHDLDADALAAVLSQAKTGRS